MDALSIAFYAALVVAVLATGAAVAAPPLRARLLVLAAVSFAVAGILGILSIGVLLLAASGVCAWQAFRHSRHG